MPLYKSENIGQASKLGLWKCTETYNDLFQRLELDENSLQKLASFTNEKRKIHFLATRLLIQQFTGHKGISYANSGKPFTTSTNQHISISHSKDFVSLLVSSSPFIGLDVQHIEPKITRIRHKFVNDIERAQIDYDDIEILTLIWSIKESIYKIHGDRNVFFKEHIVIPDFSTLSSGRLDVELDHHLYHGTHPIRFEIVENYVLVYTCFD